MRFAIATLALCIFGCNQAPPPPPISTSTGGTGSSTGSSSLGSDSGTTGPSAHGNSGIGACAYKATFQMESETVELFMCINDWPFAQCDGSDPRWEDSFHDSRDCIHAGFPYWCTPHEIALAWIPDVIGSPQWIGNDACDPRVDPPEGWEGDGVINGG